MSKELDEYVKAVEAALGALDGLGSHSAIADHFGQMGIKGFQGMAFDCPMARYLRVTVPSDRFCALLGGMWWRVEDLNGTDVLENMMQRYHNVGNFIAAFDAGLHPGLEERKND